MIVQIRYTIMVRDHCLGLFRFILELVRSLGFGVRMDSQLVGPG